MTTIDTDDLDSLAVLEAPRCTKDVVNAVDSIPMCSHHIQKADFYDYQRDPDVAESRYREIRLCGC